MIPFFPAPPRGTTQQSDVSGQGVTVIRDGLLSRAIEENQEKGLWKAFFVEPINLESGQDL